MSDSVLFSEAEGLATITFNRPAALNACDLEMIEAIDGQLRRWRQDDRISAVLVRGDGFRVFSVGADLEILHRAASRGDQAAVAAFLRAEFRLAHLWATYPKKTISLIDGACMGLGATMAATARVRVATNLSMFSTPDCRVGLIPHLGAGHFLNTCPGKIGLFLAMTGMEIRGPGMVFAGLATHLLPADKVGRLTADNADELSVQITEVPLQQIQPAIDQCFDQRAPAEVFTVLASRPELGFQDIIRQLRHGAPLALALAFEHLKRAAGKSLDEVLKSEYRVVRRMLRYPDSLEGLRAMIVERDRTPHWKMRDLAAIAPASLEEYFAPLTDEPELYFAEN